MNIIAVTACPAGIAHSQMAAEGLEQAGERLGHSIKVEVDGPLGKENELTDKDIEDADVCILATSISVQRDRFHDLPTLKASPKRAIVDPEGLIEDAVALLEKDT